MAEFRRLRLERDVGGRGLRLGRDGVRAEQAERGHSGNSFVRCVGVADEIGGAPARFEEQIIAERTFASIVD